MASIDLSKYEEQLDEEFATQPEDEDEAYLGEATLAKLRTGDLSFDEEEKPSAEQPRPERLQHLWVRR